MVRILDLLIPPSCAVCGTLLPSSLFDSPMCDKCMAEWERARSVCLLENRGQPMTVFDEELLKTEQGGTALWTVYYTAGTRLTAVNRLIFRLKEQGNKRTVHFFARELAAMLEAEAPVLLSGGACHDKAVITWIPRRRDAVSKYGFDHMKRTASALSGLVDIESQPILCRRMFTREQKRLTKKERMKNMERSMCISKRYSVCGKTVVLIDDIITSGASLHTASRLLLSAGAERVIAVCIAASDSPLD